MIKLLQYILCLLLIGMSCQSVQAHRLDATETTISFNPRTQHVEIIHKFYLHDVNHLIQQHFASNPDANRASKNDAFVQYILKGLKLNVSQAEKPLEFVGAEEDGKFFYIYQEVSIKEPKTIKFISVDTRSMKNSWKPSHWLFSVEIPPHDDKSFVIHKSEYQYQLKLQ